MSDSQETRFEKKLANCLVLNELRVAGKSILEPGFRLSFDYFLISTLSSFITLCLKIKQLYRILPQQTAFLEHYFQGVF
jgi:hypothetical protein